MLKCYKFTEYFRLTEALSLNLPPESVVLPLNHSPIVIISVLRLQRYKDFYKSKQKRVFFSQKTDKIP